MRTYCKRHQRSRRKGEGSVGDLLHCHGGLDSALDSIESGSQAQVVHGLALLADCILSIDPSPINVLLLNRLQHHTTHHNPVGQILNSSSITYNVYMSIAY